MCQHKVQWQVLLTSWVESVPKLGATNSKVTWIFFFYLNASTPLLVSLPILQLGLRCPCVPFGVGIGYPIFTHKDGNVFGW